MKSLIQILFVVLLPLPHAQAQEPYSQIRIPVVSSEDALRIARLGIALDHVGGKAGRWLDVFVNSRERALLSAHGVGYSVLIEDWDAEYRMRRSLEQVSAASLTGASPVEHFHLGSMGGFLTLDELKAELDSMRILYPSLISQKDSIGASIEGRPIWALKISARADVEESEPRALYTALTHAREPGGMMVLIYYMWFLLEKYGIDRQVTELLDSRELYFIPVVNPDGYAYNQSTNPLGGGMWRKNRRSNPGGSVGVDLNRNYGFEWGYDDLGSSSNGWAETYRGESGFSEPESRAIRDFCNRKGFTAALSYHTYGDLLIYPWGYLDGDTKDSLFYRSLSVEMTRFNRYTYGTGGQTVGYVTNGDSDDWMYGDTLSKQRIYSMTPEVGTNRDGFWPSATRILPQVEQNLFANLYLSHAAGPFVTIASCDAEQNGSDTIQFRLSLATSGVLSAPMTVQLAVMSNDVEVIDSVRASVSREDPLAIRALVNRPFDPGQHASITAEMSYDGGYTRDTIRFRLGKPVVLFSEDAESSLERWVISTNNLSMAWGRTDFKAHLGSYSITESAGSPYADDYASTMTLREPLHLSGTAAELRFWTTWDIETNYDYAVVEISTDSTSWVPLHGRYTGLGSGEGKQILHSPGYDGVKHRWVEEVIDLDDYVGESIRLRFKFDSDSYVTGDGIYADDIKVLLYTPVNAVDGADTRPLAFSLEQNYPNPFNPSSTIRYTLSRADHATLRVYDLLGREVATLVNELQPAGEHRVLFDASSLATGVYVYRLTSGNASQARRLILLR